MLELKKNEKWVIAITHQNDNSIEKHLVQLKDIKIDFPFIRFENETIKFEDYIFRYKNIELYPYYTI